ncbi:hypothetical protein E1B25_01705 [Antarcticimicrobium sediminis]|uniref:Transcriptional regulator n=2 Tax=Antarcticimicrobium sediminis TaxID=2546227 RepID=A0A4R5F157_9RHOB|nr:hypothetical protein E1B25_01705 [Antarcticimicrobium sediminis]
METALDRARRCWGAEIPDWIEGLAQACMSSSQNRVAQRMGYSGSLISSVLRNQYPGDMTRVEQVYRGAFERAVVDCPALGELAMDRCRFWRSKSRKLHPANSQNVMMFRACRSCPLNNGEDA